MPVHDSMYTHSIASKLQKSFNADQHQDLNEMIEGVKSRALKASMDAADAARMMFDVLEYARNCDDPYIRNEAEKILHSPYLQEIA